MQRGRNVLLMLCLAVYTLACVSIFFMRPQGQDGADDKSNNEWGLKLLFRHALATQHPPHPQPPNIDLGNNRKKQHPRPASTAAETSTQQIKKNELYLVQAQAQAQKPQCLIETTQSNTYGCHALAFEPCDPESQKQQWRQTDVFTLRNAKTNSCLDMFRQTDDVHACPCHSDDNQRWASLPNGRLQSTFNNQKCLGYQDVAGTLSPTIAECTSPTTEFTFEIGVNTHSATEINVDKLHSLLVPRPYKEFVPVAGSDNWEDTESIDFIRMMTEFPYGGYQLHAWGFDELRPESLTGRNWLGNAGLSATIVDSLDTLYLMGLKDQYEMSAKFVIEELNFVTDNYVSFFETVIRDLGGLLSAYALTRNRKFVDKADELGQRLLPAFNSPHGLPFGLINLQTGQVKNHNWMPSNHILAEIGTVQLEFKYLAHLTGRKVYYDKAERVMTYLRELDLAESGLYPVLYPMSGTPSANTRDYTLGGLGDSYYEYELKQWLQTRRSEAYLLKMYDDSADGIRRVLVAKVGGHTFVGKYRGNLEQQMEHLACFSGGMFALGAKTRETHANTSAEFSLAAALTETCRESYRQMASGLGPEKFTFRGDGTILPDSGSGASYFLRPEYAESLFYMWRFTHDSKYRSWGWDMVNALVKHCKARAGFSGVTNVASTKTGYNDQQESYFFAETLKYLFLLFADDAALDLNEWVFNTEAHPLPVFTPSWSSLS